MGGDAGKLTGHAFQNKTTVPVYAANPDAGQVSWSDAPIAGATRPGQAGSPTAPISMGMGTPNLFNPYKELMPAEYNSSQQINNPNPILQAYLQHMPEFLAASKPQYQYKAAPYIQTGKRTSYSTDPFSIASVALAPATMGLSLGYNLTKDNGGLPSY